MGLIYKNYRLFILFSRQSFKTIFQARLGIIFFLLGKIIRFLFFLLLIFLLFTKIKIIKGYTLNQAIIFYLTFNLVDTTAQILFREVYRFRPLLVSGNFDLILTKPYHPFIKILVGGVDILDLVLIFPYLLLTFLFFIRLGNLSFLNLLTYFALLINSLIIVTAFHIAVLALGILIVSVDHTIMIYRDLTTLGRFPMEIYKEPIRGFFTFVVPVGIMMSFPPKALFGILNWPFIFYSFLLSFLLLFLSIKLWSWALKSYQSWGG